MCLKWALDDDESIDEAISIRDDAIDGKVRLVAPSIWAYEIANGLVTATRRGRVNERFGTQALDAILDIGVRLADPPVADVYRVAVRFGITSYDASYVALARALRCTLWTADGPLATTFPSDRIRHIAEYSGRG